MHGTPVLCSATELPAAAGGAPAWLHLIPAGAIRTADGRGPYRLGDVQALMAASLPAGGKLPIDETHATDLAAPKGGAAPARGWIVELQARDDGVWGRVEWTPTGRRLVEDQEYRGISPVIVHGRDKVITGLLRASLTNTPNFAGLTSLHHQETDMDLRAMVIEALGLDADASDEAIAAALKKKLEAKGDDPVVAVQSAIAPIAAAIGLAAGADAAAVLAGVQQLQGGDKTIVALQAELSDLGTKYNALNDTLLRDRAVAFVDGAIAEGRVGVKPQRDRYITMHMADPANAAALIGALPRVATGATLIELPAEKDKAGLGAADRQVVALMGLDPAEYAKTLAADGKAVL